MPLNIPDNLPATDILANEYVFVMQEHKLFTRISVPCK